MSRALDLSEKNTFQLVWLSHAGGDTFYTDWTSDFSFRGNTYLSRPTMQVQVPKNTGTLEDLKATIEMTLEDGILTDLTSGDAHAVVEVTVYELTKPTSTGPSATVRTTFLGIIIQGSRNINGKRGQVRLQAIADKSLTAVAMGDPMNHLCSNSLGDRRCQIDMSVGQNSFFGTIGSITDRTVTISIASSYNSDERYFHRGYLSYQGLRIMVRDWVKATPTVFTLVRRPPASWLGKTVLVASGCDKSVETCVRRYSNEENFRGNGHAIPSYNPWLET